jgi:predicted GNAT family acetyltransferase
MAVMFMGQESSLPGGAWGQTLDTQARPLADEHEAEALAFLAVRPVHTVYLTTLIRDNGLTSPLNRGTFYGCRDANGRLTGVALIGHATLFESDDDATLAAFAQLTQACPHAHLIRGEQARVKRFWRYYETRGRRPRRVARELLLEQRPPVEVHAPVPGLRLATSADLNELLPINAEMIESECGVNPLKRDAIGFRVRLLRRIEQGRIWVWTRAGRIAFKTDVLANTAAAAYLEGVWVHPAERGRGYGLRCLSQLGRLLLAHTETVSLVVNEKATGARAFYHKAGYRHVARYDTIYL